MNHYHVTHYVHIATFTFILCICLTNHVKGCLLKQLTERESTFLYMTLQVGQITFEKDLDLQVEMAVMEQLGNVLEDGKRIFLGP